MDVRLNILRSVVLDHPRHLGSSFWLEVVRILHLPHVGSIRADQHVMGEVSSQTLSSYLHTKGVR